MRVRYTQTALVDLSDIFAYIAADDPAAAARVLQRIEHVVSRLALFPGTAHGCDIDGVLIAPLVRYPYSIYYTVERDELVVLHVRHGARRSPAFHEPASAFAC